MSVFTRRVRSAVPWVWAGSIVLVGIPVAVIGTVRGLVDAEVALQVALALVYAVLGLTIAVRQPGNGVAWILLLVGTGIVLNGVAVLVTVEPSNSESLWRVLAIVWTNIGYFVTLILPLLLLLYIFPTGHFLTRRWSWAGWATAIASAALIFAEVFTSDVALDGDPTTVRNPLGIHDLGGIEDGFFSFVVGACLLALVAGGPVAIVLRYRRSSTLVRAQIKLVVLAMALIPLLMLTGTLFADSWVNAVTFLAAMTAVPTAMTAAIVRHNLFDIDVVISKTLTFGVLAVFITAVYAVIVVGIGSFVGGGDEPNLALSIVAVAVVAVAFEPVRSRVQHWANVLVYGKRANPYEVLVNATARLSDTTDPDEALARVTQLVVEGTGAAEAVLWLMVGGVMYPHASSPEDVQAGLGPVAGDDPVVSIAGDRVVAVRHRGDVLGALSIKKAKGDAVTGSDEKVLEDVAAGAGVLLRNMGLNVELAERAEQLRVSRRRLVAAQDAERRRLERDLHDGAQQQVVALKVKLGIARTLAEREGADAVADLVESLSDTTQEAVDGMRAVAHGIYPPLLQAEGLGAALSGMRRTVSIPVDVTVVAVPRYEQSVEESTYFCVVEVIAKAVDAGASRVDVSMTGSDSALVFVIGSDAAGTNLQAIEDRVAAFDGSLEVSRQGPRSVVTGSLPAGERSLEPA